jgi:hypothetical protein
MNIFKNIREAVQRGDYALRPHAAAHMLAEGFDEADIVRVAGNGKIIEYRAAV